VSCLVTLAAQALCLVSYGDITLRADASAQVGGTIRHLNDGIDYGGALIGRIELSLPLVTYRGFSLQAGIRHESLLNTGRDRGEERAGLSITWQPFGGAR
jgi:hypothetical protein